MRTLHFRSMAAKKGTWNGNLRRRHMADNDVEQVRHAIQGFLHGGLGEWEWGEWEWDDFISTPIFDTYCDGIRKICLALPDKYPPPTKDCYCNDEGYRILKIILAELL